VEWCGNGWVNGVVPFAVEVVRREVDGVDLGVGSLELGLLVADFHQLGQHMICYIDVGTWENWRSEASAFSAAVLGDANDWPGERWLDIRQLSVLEPIMTARFQICAQKGFDAVEPDNMDGFENSTGFPISAAQQLSYDEWVAQEVHLLGMAVLQRNDHDQAAKLEPCFGPSTTTPPIAGPPPTTGSAKASSSSGRAVDKVARKVRIGRGGLEARSDVVAVSSSCPRGLGGRSALVKVKLSEPVLRKLGRRNRIRVRVQVTARDVAERRGQATLATVPNLRRSPAGRR
jgi:hypothetical protein